MHPIFKKTFGGLTGGYYFRQLFFGALIAAMCFYTAIHVSSAASPRVPTMTKIFMIVNVFLYPYARFVYEGIVNFIIGENIFFVNIFIMFPIKFFTMAMCFVFAIFIAPIGLAYLYWHHSR